MIADRHVELPITVEVAHGHGSRTATHREVEGRLEGPIAITQQHRDIVGLCVRGRYIELPIAIEVAHGHGSRTTANGEVEGCLEGPIAVAEQYRDSPVISV